MAVVLSLKQILEQAAIFTDGTDYDPTKSMPIPKLFIPIYSYDGTDYSYLRFNLSLDEYGNLVYIYEGDLDLQLSDGYLEYIGDDYPVVFYIGIIDENIVISDVALD